MKSDAHHHYYSGRNLLIADDHQEALEIDSNVKRSTPSCQVNRNQARSSIRGSQAGRLRESGPRAIANLRLPALTLLALLLVAPAAAWSQDSWSPPAQPMHQSGNSYSEPRCRSYTPFNCQHDAWSSRWRGAYAGVYFTGVGGAGVIDRTSGNEFTIDNSGTHLGGLVGYNFGSLPMTPCSGWLWGAEFDFSAIGGSETKNDATFGDVKIDGDWLTSMQVRGGYAWENTYLFATTGIAMSDINVMASTENVNSIHAGWAFGVGIEQKINHHWSARFDAIGYSFGSRGIDLNGSSRDVSLGAGQIRLGIMRRF